MTEPHPAGGGASSSAAVPQMGAALTKADMDGGRHAASPCQAGGYRRPGVRVADPRPVLPGQDRSQQVPQYADGRSPLSIHSRRAGPGWFWLVPRSWSAR